MSIFGKFGDWLDDGGGSFINSALGFGGGLYSIDQGLAAADRMENLGNYLNDYAVTQGGLLSGDSQFKGYGITSGLGITSGENNADGQFGFNFGVDQNQDLVTGGNTLRGAGSTMMTGGGTAFNNALAGYGNYNPGAPTQAAMTAAMADPAAREQYFYDRAMAMQNPELNRQQMAQQAQEYAMGRGGIRGTQYGGTAEDAAMARARADASRQAAVDAISMAQNERKMYGDMASQFGQMAAQRGQGITQVGQAMGELGQRQLNTGLDMEKLSYLPMDMQLQILQQANNGAAMSQQGQLTGQGFLSQMILGGMGNNINAQKVANETRADLMSALLANLGGSTGSDGSSLSGLGGLLSQVTDGAEWLWNKLKDNDKPSGFASGIGTPG